MDWMLAIDFDDPRLLKIAKKMEDSDEFPVYIFIENFEAKAKRPRLRKKPKQTKPPRETVDL